VQEALHAATEQWPRDGIPENPRGWLIQVAVRRMTDSIRSETARRRREEVVAAETPATVPIADPAIPPDGLKLDPDDTLVLLFLCCHPALTPSSVIALTLRAVAV
jgi:predicted RNA polymerase sigma factor